MSITVAKTSGYCYGVTNAMKKTGEFLSLYPDERTVSYGPLIHNRQAMKEYYDRGLKEFDRIDQLEQGSNVIIRSHGVTEQIREELQQRSDRLLDCTCPFVKKIQRIVSEAYKNGKKVVIVGDSTHPEVIGLSGWTDDQAIIHDDTEFFETFRDEGHMYIVVQQTTFQIEKYKIIKKALQTNVKNIEFYDTICYATKERQDEAEKLSHNVDLMIVIGGKQSSNTAKLTAICEKNCQTIQIETKEELLTQDTSAFEKIGITAGASTPDFVIKAVVQLVAEQKKTKELDLMNMDMENMENTEMGKLLLIEEENYQEVYKGSIIKGTVEIVKPDSYYITLNYKTDGVLPKSEINDDEDIQAGDELELEVVKIDKNTGEILLSKKRVDEIKVWDDLEEGKVVPVKIVDRNEKGLIAKYKNAIRGFIPLSHVENRFINESVLNDYINEEFEVEVLDVIPKKRRLILSRKNVLNKAKEEQKLELMEKIQVDNIYKGIVRDIKDYGLFVDLGGLTGLVHISELSWSRKVNPAKSYKVGEEVEVKVLSFDKERERLSLSIKALAPDPWDLFLGNYTEGSEVRGEVKNIKDYGVFVTLQEGIDGFIHISNLSSAFIKNPQEVVSVGQEVDAKIINIDRDNRKIELTMNVGSEDNDEDVEGGEEMATVEGESVDVVENYSPDAEGFSAENMESGMGEEAVTDIIEDTTFETPQTRAVDELED